MSDHEWKHFHPGTNNEFWECKRPDRVTTTVYRVDRDGDVEVNVDSIYGLDSISAYIPRDILEAALKPLEEERS